MIIAGSLIIVCLMLLLGVSEWFTQTDLTAPIACAAIGLTWLTRSTR